MFDELKNFNYRSLLTTRRYLSLTVAVGLISLLIVFMGILPQFQNILEVQQQVAAEAKDVDALQRKAIELQELPSSSLFAQADKLNEALPTTKPLLQLLTSLQAAGAQAQVNISEVDITPGTLATESAQTSSNTGSTLAGRRGATSNRGSSNSSAYDSLDVDLTVNGTTEQINQFFSLIERVTPITTITQISLQKQNRPNQPGSFFSADIRVTTYYFTQSIKASTDAPLPPITSQEEAIVNDIADFVTTPVQTQTQVTGGGLQDLFGVTPQQLPQ